MIQQAIKITPLCLALLGMSLNNAMAHNSAVKSFGNSFVAHIHSPQVTRLYFNCVAGCASQKGPSYFSLLHGSTAIVRASGYTIFTNAGNKLDVKFMHSNARASAVVSHQFGTTSYFSGLDAARSHKVLANYRNVAYRSVYPGIDVVFKGSGNNLEYDFDVHPQANVADIAIEFPKKRFKMQRNGSIAFPGFSGKLIQEKPVVYQKTNIGYRQVDARYVLDNVTGVIRIHVGHYDHSQPLIIDPLIMQYGVYRDGGNVMIDDGVIKVVTDAAGNLYVAGTATDGAYPRLGGTLTFSSNGGTGAPYCYFGCTYLEKYDANGNLIYSTIIDGAHSNDMALENNGNVYLAGSTTADFSTTIEVSNPEDGFITAVSADGKQLIYSRQIAMFNSGGSADYLACMGILGITVDSQGDVYFIASSPFANNGSWTTPNALQSAQNGSSSGVIGEFDPTGSTLLYGTYWGGSGAECPTSIKLDGAGSLYVAGRTTSKDFPVTSGTYGGGDYQGYITKFNLADWSVGYSYYFGGNSTSTINDVEMDGAGGVYIGGQTWSTDLPGTTGAYQSKPAGEPSGFISHLDSNGNVIASTYFGGSVRSEISTLTLDENGDVFFGGRTLDRDLPITTDALQDFNVATYGLTDSGYSGFIGELDADLKTLLYGTYYGGNFTTPVLGYGSSSEIRSLSVDSTSTLYVGGETETSDAPATVPFINDVPGNAGSNGFWARFRKQDLTITTPTLFALLIVNKKSSFQLNAAGGTPPYVWQVSTGMLPGGYSLSTEGVLSGQLQTSLLPGPPQNQFDFVIMVTDANGQSASKYFFMPFDYPLMIDGGLTSGVLTENTPFEDYVTLSGGFNSFDCSIASGRLPPGLTLSNTSIKPACLISGTPTATGVYTYTLEVKDILGQQVDYGPFTFDVNAPKSTSSGSSTGGGGYFGFTDFVFTVLCFLAMQYKSKSHKRRVS